jgi:hypothetical protein
MYRQTARSILSMNSRFFISHFVAFLRFGALSSYSNYPTSPILMFQVRLLTVKELVTYLNETHFIWPTDQVVVGT